MPYVDKDTRDSLEEAVSGICRAVAETAEINSRAGILNYVLTRLLDSSTPSSYKGINETIGVLECCKQEFYRRVAVPYETEKWTDNGDVYEPR